MKRYLPLLFVIVLSLVSILPLFSPGYFPMHDDTQVARIITMGRALREGQFPVRWVSDLGYGYGYPIFNFYGPLPYYFGGALFILGVPALLATKIMFAVGILLPALILYGVITSFVGWQAGMVSSLLFLYAPYHAVQTYVRGAVGESWTLIFWPIIFYAFASQAKPKEAFGRMVIGAIGISGAIVSHTLLGYATMLLFVSGLFCYWLIRWIRGRRDAPLVIRHSAMVLLGLGLSAFFWLPAIREMGYTSVSGQVSETANFMDHFVCIGQLWSSLWGYGGSVAGCVDGMSFMLGKWHLIIAFFGIIGWFIVRPKEGKTVFAVGLAIALLGTFFVTSYSRVVWQILPGFGYVQYPWRFLALSGFGLSLVGGLVVLYIPNGWWRTGIALIVAVWILGMNAKWFTPQYTYSKMSSDFENSQDIKWRVSKISDEYLPFDIVRPKDASQVVFDTIREADGLTVSKHKDTAIWEQIVVEATRSSDVVINKAYFPGWRYYVNNREVSPHIVQGLPRVSISEGRSVIDIKFTDTPVRTIANLISLGSLMIVGVTWYEKQRKPNR